MADVITRLRLESNEYDSKLKRAVDQMARMEQQCRRTGASFAYADKEEQAFVRSLGSMQTQAQSAKGKLREYTDAITSLTASYRELSAEEKSSEFGKAMAASIEQLKAKAAELKDVMSDTQQEITRMSSDTGTFDQIAGGIGTVVAAFQVAQGTMQLFGVKNEEATAAMSKLMALMAITSGLTKVQTALQKQSATMIGITTLQKKAAAAAEALDTAAKGKNIVVTKSATIAQSALNKVAMANPYVLLAMAIVGVGAALYGLAKRQNESKRAEEAAQKAAEREQEAFNKRGESIGHLIGKYTLLKNEWGNLTTAAEKSEWISKNKSAFDELGISVRNVADAENAFIRNSDKMIEALTLRAQASALESIITQDYEDYYRALEKHGGGVKNGDRMPMSSEGLHGSEATPSNMMWNAARRAGLGDGDYDYRTMTLTEQGAQKYNNFLAAKEGVVIDTSGAIRELNDLKTRANGILSEIGIKPAGGSTETKIVEEVLPAGSIAELRQRIQNVQKEWEMATDTNTRSAKSQELEQLQEQLDQLTGKAKTAKGALSQVEYTGSGELSMKSVSARMSHAKKAMDNADIGSDRYLYEADKIVDLTTFQNLLKAATEAGMTIDTSFVEDTLGQIDLGVGVSDEAWQQMVDTINAKLAELDLPPIELDVKTGGVKALNKEVSGTIDHVSGAAAAFQALGDAMSNIDDPGAKVAGMIAQAIGSVVAGYGTATAQAATMGPWAWIAFAATGLATMIATIAGIKSATAGSYASGGLIPGNSFSGDNLMANVNSGELILNRAQQSNLANQLTEGGINNLHLATDIEGTKLRIVLENDNRSKGGSRGAYSRIK